MTKCDFDVYATIIRNISNNMEKNVGFCMYSILQKPGLCISLLKFKYYIIFGT